MKKSITIATRESKLALWQANQVKAALHRHHPDLRVELLPLTSSGDIQVDIPLADIGGKALFVKELEQALLAQQADIAVHSVKDMPPLLPQGLTLAGTLPREQANDCLLHPEQMRLTQMAQGAVIGTSSPRRAALIQHYHRHLRPKPIRGNIGTRLQKLADQHYDAIVLAYAGLKRLGYDISLVETLPLSQFVPAAGQGAIGMECRSDDDNSKQLIATINHPETLQCIQLEQQLLQTLSGDCHSAIGAYAAINQKQITLTAMVLSSDGQEVLRGTLSEPMDSTEAKTLGTKLGQRLLNDGARSLLAPMN